MAAATTTHATAMPTITPVDREEAPVHSRVKPQCLPEWNLWNLEAQRSSSPMAMQSAPALSSELAVQSAQRKGPLMGQLNVLAMLGPLTGQLMDLQLGQRMGQLTEK